MGLPRSDRRRDGAGIGHGHQLQEDSPCQQDGPDQPTGEGRGAALPAAWPPPGQRHAERGTQQQQ